MTTMNFDSSRPDLYAADVEHGELGRRYEEALFSEAYLNPHHRLHNKTVADVRSLAEAIYGDAPIGTGNSQMLPVEGEFAAPTVATSEGLADEHNKTD